MDLFYSMNLQHCKLKKPKTLKYWETVHIFSLYLLECFWLQETKMLAETDLDNKGIYCRTKWTDHKSGSRALLI